MKITQNNHDSYYQVVNCLAQSHVIVTMKVILLTFFSDIYLIETFPKQALVFTRLQYNTFENTVGKGEIARNEQFLLFPVFSTRFNNLLSFPSNLKLLSANSFSLEESKNCHLGKG